MLYQIIVALVGHPEGEITDLADRDEAAIATYLESGHIVRVSEPASDFQTPELDNLSPGELPTYLSEE